MLSAFGKLRFNVWKGSIVRCFPFSLLRVNLFAMNASS